MRFILLFSLFFTGCVQIPSITRTQVIMGTFCSIELEEKYSTSIDKGFIHLKKLESIFSSYQKNALLSQLNSKRTVPTNNRLKDILKQSKAYHHVTHGYFDITIGSITKGLYHFGEDEQIPTQEKLNQAILGIDNISLGKNDIQLKNHIILDLGGIAKGYSVDSLATLYKKRNIHKGKIALFGDIRCLSSCKIAIQSPFHENKTLGILSSKNDNLSVSTSGTYRRYVKEKAHHHLINPKTKTQGRAFVSVTIIAQNNNTLCDAMATAISTMPKEVALTFVRSQKEFAYILVTNKKEILTGNLEKFVDFKHSPYTIQHKQ